MNMMDMFGKLNELKSQTAEMKKRLANITVEQDFGDGSIKILASADREIRSVEFNSGFLKNVEKEELEDMLMVTINRVLEKAKEVEEAEMKSIAGGMLPGFPGMG